MWIPFKDRKLSAFDVETFLSVPGRYVPRLVCGSFYDDADAAADAEAELTGGPSADAGTLLDRQGTRQVFESLIRDFARTGGMVAGANVAFDFAVMGSDFPELLPAIFELYEADGVFDVLIGQALDHVAKGHLFKAPDGGPMLGADGKIRKRYSLDLVVYQRLGRDNAKVHDEWRMRYGDLSALPIDQWPFEARVYPIDDARNTYQVARDLISKASNMDPIVRYIPNRPASEWVGVRADWFNGRQGVQLSHPGLNAFAAFCLHLLTAWGIRTDAAKLRELIARSEQKHAEEVARFVAIGMLKAGCEKHKEAPGSFDPSCAKCVEERGKENGREVKRAIIRAYNHDRGDVPCPACGGAGEVPSPKTGNPIQCKPCAATGLDAGNAPITPGGGVQASRDACLQSGNDDLADLKESNNRKIRQTYIPFLSQGTVSPIHVSANALVKTARTSFGKGDEGDETPGLLQTFPRKGGARETIVAGEFPDASGEIVPWVLCSNDWAALEFYNLGQAQKWVCGYSPILDALREGKDPHVMLGSKMTGTVYDEFQRNRKADVAKTRSFFNDVRQGSKPGNYGYGGRMGPARMAFTQRIQRVGGHGSMCRLLHREPARGCGSEKITVWKKRPISTGPVCAACVEVCEELRQGWLEVWQLAEYFAWVDSHEGIQDGNAVMVTPGTGYIRGGLNVSEGCNHPFQHQGGYGSKLALIMVSRECYVNHGTPLYGCRPQVFAHDEILTGMPQNVAHLAAARQTELMKAAMSTIVPDLEVPIEPALMRRWYKEAEPFFFDRDCVRCRGVDGQPRGWLYLLDGQGEPFRKECPDCKTHGILSPWEPMADRETAIKIAEGKL